MSVTPISEPPSPKKEQTWRARPDVMEETEVIADEICPLMFGGKSLNYLQTTWENRTLVFQKELHELFRFACCVRYLRNGIDPVWLDKDLIEKAKFFCQPVEPEPPMEQPDDDTPFNYG